MNKLWLVALFLAVPACSGASKKSSTPKAEAQRMEWKAPFGGPSDAGTRVVDNPDAWKRLWDMLGQPGNPAPDFSKYVALAVFMGPRNTGGYAVVWDEPKTEDTRVLVRYSIAPPKGMAMQALTQPWAVRLFPKKDKPYALELK